LANVGQISPDGSQSQCTNSTITNFNQWMQKTVPDGSQYKLTNSVLIDNYQIVTEFLPMVTEFWQIGVRFQLIVNEFG
jgi:hypothetical protein